MSRNGWNATGSVQVATPSGKSWKKLDSDGVIQIIRKHKQFGKRREVGGKSHNTRTTTKSCSRNLQTKVAESKTPKRKMKCKQSK
jgi:predicted aldo/keto reductase-like oxidoreductase